MEAKSEMHHREILSLIGHWTTSGLIAGLEVLRGVECLSRLPKITCPVLLLAITSGEVTNNTWKWPCSVSGKGNPLG